MLTAGQRRGFTLVEIVISTGLMLIVSGAVYQTLTLSQRLSRAQTQQVGVQSDVRSATLVLLNEMRPLGSGGDSDLLSIAPDAMTYRADRGVGFLCQPSTATQLRFDRESFSGHRDPQAGRDSVLVLVENQPQSAPDSWIRVAITAVAAGSCAGGGTPAITLTVFPTPALEGLAPGTPVRIQEVMELRLYRPDGRSWLGLRSIGSGENIQPFAGPVHDGDGLRLEYLNALGIPTADRHDVQSIRITLKGESEGTANFGAFVGEHVPEEMTSQVTLRNVLP